MAAIWMRRTLITAAACASAVLLAACGSSSTADAITPSRMISFGDSISDIGQNPNGRAYSVNNGTINNWTEEVANRHGLSISAAKVGGTSYAQGNARVALPDASGVTNAPSVTQQIDSYLAANPTFQERDFVLISGGQSDLIAGMNAYLAGTLSYDDYMAGLTTAGNQLAAQVKRLNTAGAPRVLSIGTINVSRTLWAKNLDNVYPTADPKPTAVLQSATEAFNQALLVALRPMDGRYVLYSDAEYYFNTMTGNPGAYSFSISDRPICTTADATNAQNVGTDQINSSLCTADTLVAGADVNNYLFADTISFTPRAHTRFGDWVYDRMTANW